MEGELKPTVIPVLFLACAAFLTPGARSEGSPHFEELKRWHSQTPRGEIGVHLLALRPCVSGELVFESVGELRPPVHEEAELLRQVLRDMPRLGCNPASSLATIHARLRETEYLEGVESAVLRSGIWKSCTGRKYCDEAKGVADSYLASVKAFKEFDDVLAEFGLRTKPAVMDYEMGAGFGVRDGRFRCMGVILIDIEKQDKGGVPEVHGAK